MFPPQFVRICGVMKRVIALFAVLALLTGSAAYFMPRAEQALALRLAADDPVRLAQLRLAMSFNAGAAHRQ